MAKGGGGGGGVDAGFFLENGKSFCKLNFQLYTDLALKLDKGRILGGGKRPPPPHHGLILPIFLTTKMKFNLNKFWYKVR